MAAGPFGFDLDLAYRHGQGSGNTVPEMQEIMNGAQARQLKAAQLQQEQYQQQRERSLAQLVSQNANAYADPAARAYALGGFGEQAQAAQAQAFQRQQMQAQMAYQQQQRQTELQESAIKLDNIHRDLTASRLAAVKSQEDFDKIAGSVPDEYGLKAGDTNWQDAVKTFRQSRITPEQAAENQTKQDAIDKNRFEVKFNPVTGAGYKEDKMTGELSPLSFGSSSGGAPSQGAPSGAQRGAPNPYLSMKPNEVEKAWKDFTGSVSTVHGRSNLAADQQKRLQAVDRLDGILARGNTTPEEQQLLATDLASVYAGGGAPTESSIQHLSPHTWRGDLAKSLQYALSTPQESGNSAFLDRIKGNVAELRKTLNQDMQSAQLQEVPNYMGLRRVDPSRFDSILKGAGIDPVVISSKGHLITTHTPDELAKARKWLSDPSRGTPQQRKAVQAILDGE